MSAFVPAEVRAYSARDGWRWPTVSRRQSLAAERWSRCSDSIGQLNSSGERPVPLGWLSTTICPGLGEVNTWQW